MDVKNQILFLLALACTPWSSAQTPDFNLELSRINTSLRGSKSEVTAHAQLYSDGENLTLYVKVRDPHIQSLKSSLTGDHIEVWFALPVSAYPSGFDYNHHPEYIYAPPKPGTQETPRFFSIYSEYATEVDLGTFLQRFDYPDANTIRKDSLHLPQPSALRQESIHFGMVHFGLYPDNRAAVQYDQQKFKRLEESLGVKAGNMAQGIKYTVERLDDDEGYVINAQISPQALGFVTLPEMRQLMMLVEVVDSDPRVVTPPTLSTSVKRVAGKPSTFNTVYLQRPLKCPFSEVPPELLQRLDLHPTYFYSEKGWIPTAVATDALVFQENQTSQALTEVKFANQPIKYKSFSYRYNPVEYVEVAFEPVNAIPSEVRYILIRDQVIKTKLVQGSIRPQDSIKQSFFVFPDGTTGMIMAENAPRDPYGWGECGACLEERILIYRLNMGRLESVLNVVQGDGPNPYFQVYDQSFNDYRMRSLHWAREGEILVLVMQHRYKNFTKRVKISWGKNGQKLKIMMID